MIDELITKGCQTIGMTGQNDNSPGVVFRTGILTNNANGEIVEAIAIEITGNQRTPKLIIFFSLIK